MNEFTQVGQNGEYALLYFPTRTFAFVWAWRPSTFCGRLIWEQGHYFETRAQALDFMQPDAA